jgi:hypothetical protein
LIDRDRTASPTPAPRWLVQCLLASPYLLAAGLALHSRSSAQWAIFALLVMTPLMVRDLRAVRHDVRVLLAVVKWFLIAVPLGVLIGLPFWLAEAAAGPEAGIFWPYASLAVLMTMLMVLVCGTRLRQGQRIGGGALVGVLALAGVAPILLGMLWRGIGAGLDRILA